MRFFKTVALIAIAMLLHACNGKMTVNRSGLSIQVANEQQLYPLGSTLDIELKNPKQLALNDVQFFYDEEHVASQDPKVTLTLKDKKVGIHQVKAQVVVEDDTLHVVKNITVVSDKTPKVFTYKVLNEYPHDIDAYTQGLEFREGVLYEGTGSYGKSSLRKVDYKTGVVEKNIPLSKNLFGEGITIMNDNIYQLTWKAKTGFIYDLNTLERKNSFTYGKSKEGWGLCNDGKLIYKSDGTENIWTLHPETLVEQGHIQCYTNKKKIKSVNELEWVDGKIYANIYQQNGVAIIDPANGVVEGVIDFSPLKKEVQQHEALDVLNGIAYNKDTGTLFVTGKNWNKLFEVEIMEKQ